jgi:hypothetical protein
MGFSLKKKLSFTSKKTKNAYKVMEHDGEGEEMHTEETTPTSSAFDGQNPFTISIHDETFEGEGVEVNDDDDTVIPQELTLADLDSLVNTLARCKETYDEEPSRALRVLFTLSENHESFESNRIQMVKDANGRLVPTLIKFLQRCQSNSSEQYLALLVLNNISIPLENKKIVAIDYQGAYILARMLCLYPDCSLIAIILVNLCFCESSLRVKLVGKDSSIQLVEAFTYALKTSIQPERGMIQSKTDTEIEPSKLLRELIAKEEALSTDERTTLLFHQENIAYPETARWCLSGMKNLSRPSKDPIAALTLIQCGALDAILKILTIDTDFIDTSNMYPGVKVDNGAIRNDPYVWDSNSMQDAALYILMNLAITPATRFDLRKPSIVRKISAVADFSSSPSDGTSNHDEEEQKNLQCLKARMTLSYLFGSEGHFGQGGSDKLKYRSEDIIVKGSEATSLVEMLSNVLHGRGKADPGGYSPSTFNTKKTLFAIRCLLTNRTNVKTFFVTCGVKLNVLLLKAIAFHSIQRMSGTDIEAAEDACFSLYLLSSYGFMAPFLPPLEEGYPFEKILTAYLHRENCSPVGKHAATQLLLRHPYLNCAGNIRDDEPHHIDESDLIFDASLLDVVDEMSLSCNLVGEEPLDDIFGRPLTRSNLKQDKTGKKQMPWDNVDGEMSMSFHSALDAMKELSYGSKIFSHSGDIDDIKIANDIAKCANGEKTKAYGFRWEWQDGCGPLKEEDVRQKLNDFRSGKMDSFRGLLKNVRNRERPNEPISIFGINCGCNSVI